MIKRMKCSKNVFLLRDVELFERTQMMISSNDFIHKNKKVEKRSNIKYENSTYLFFFGFKRCEDILRRWTIFV